jgi:hypothetical protein
LLKCIEKEKDSTGSAQTLTNIKQAPLIEMLTYGLGGPHWIACLEALESAAQEASARTKIVVIEAALQPLVVLLCGDVKDARDCEAFHASIFKILAELFTLQCGRQVVSYLIDSISLEIILKQGHKKTRLGVLSSLMEETLRVFLSQDSDPDLRLRALEVILPLLSFVETIDILKATASYQNHNLMLGRFVESLSINSTTDRASDIDSRSTTLHKLQIKSKEVMVRLFLSDSSGISSGLMRLFTVEENYGWNKLRSSIKGLRRRGSTGQGSERGSTSKTRPFLTPGSFRLGARRISGLKGQLGSENIFRAFELSSRDSLTVPGEVPSTHLLALINIYSDFVVNNSVHE